jgi:hypothetical protein
MPKLRLSVMLNREIMTSGKQSLMLKSTQHRSRRFCVVCFSVAGLPIGVLVTILTLKETTQVWFRLFANGLTTSGGRQVVEMREFLEGYEQRLVEEMGEQSSCNGHDCSLRSDGFQQHRSSTVN